MPNLHSSEGAVRIRLLGASCNSIGGLTFRQPDSPEFFPGAIARPWGR
jgi:hypothetical protein